MMMKTLATSPASLFTIICYTSDVPGPPNCMYFLGYSTLSIPLPIYILEMFFPLLGKLIFKSRADIASLKKVKSPVP